MRRMVFILIIILACLAWLASPGTIEPGSRRDGLPGEGKESVVSVIISSSRIAFTWGMPAALLYQLHTLLVE